MGWEGLKTKKQKITSKGKILKLMCFTSTDLWTRSLHKIIRQRCCIYQEKNVEVRKNEITKKAILNAS